MTGEPLSG